MIRLKISKSPPLTQKALLTNTRGKRFPLRQSLRRLMIHLTNIIIRTWRCEKSRFRFWCWSWQRQRTRLLVATSLSARSFCCRRRMGCWMQLSIWWVEGIRWWRSRFFIIWLCVIRRWGSWRNVHCVWRVVLSIFMRIYNLSPLKALPCV